MPFWITDVAQSSVNGNGSSVGILNVNGLVPSIFSTPNVGATDGLALVPLIPIIFSFAARPVQYPAIP